MVTDVGMQEVTTLEGKIIELLQQWYEANELWREKRYLLPGNEDRAEALRDKKEAEEELMKMCQILFT